MYKDYNNSKTVYEKTTQVFQKGGEDVTEVPRKIWEITKKKSFEFLNVK